MGDVVTIGYVCEGCGVTFFAPEGYPDVLPDACRECHTEFPWEVPDA